jgi:hypothetical protein
MVLKIYGGLSLVVAALAAVTFFTGNLNEFTLPIFGFVVSTLFFMGFVAVMPWWMDKMYAPKYYPGRAKEQLS